MKKLVSTIFALLVCSGMLFAQELSVGTSSISKVDRPCVIAAYTMPAEIVKDALSDKLKKSKITKGSKVKGGFRVYRGVSIPEISKDKIDVYTRVTGKNDNSTLFFAVSRGYDNFITPETDSEVVEKVKIYVKSMMANVNIAKIKTDIAAQAKVLNKAEKVQKTKLKAGDNLINEQKNLENKLKKNKSEQESNMKDQEAAALKVKEEQAMMEELKSKLEMMIKQ